MSDVSNKKKIVMAAAVAGFLAGTAAPLTSALAGEGHKDSKTKHECKGHNGCSGKKAHGEDSKCGGEKAKKGSEGCGGPNGCGGDQGKKKDKKPEGK